jgi:hypothetical protein
MTRTRSVTVVSSFLKKRSPEVQAAGAEGHNLNVLVSEADYLVYTELAELRGQNISEFVRCALAAAVAAREPSEVQHAEDIALTRLESSLTRNARRKLL